jgi:GTP-dependent phosphoenolpyruvate carboxykinase
MTQSISGNKITKQVVTLFSNTINKKNTFVIFNITDENNSNISLITIEITD